MHSSESPARIFRTSLVTDCTSEQTGLWEEGGVMAQVSSLGLITNSLTITLFCQLGGGKKS